MVRGEIGLGRNERDSRISFQVAAIGVRCHYKLLVGSPRCLAQLCLPSTLTAPVKESALNNTDRCELEARRTQLLHLFLSVAKRRYILEKEIFKSKNCCILLVIFRRKKVARLLSIYVAVMLSIFFIFSLYLNDFQLVGENYYF